MFWYFCLSVNGAESAQICLKSFDTVQGFEKCYIKHHETFDSDTTHILNKKHKIDA